jgi:hypothetical protein
MWNLYELGIRRWSPVRTPLGLKPLTPVKPTQVQQQAPVTGQP